MRSQADICCNMQDDHQNIRQKASKAVKEDLGKDHVDRVGEGEDDGEEGQAEQVALPEKRLLRKRESYNHLTL